MPVAIKLLFPLILIVLLLLLKIHLALTLLLASISIALLFGVSPLQMLSLAGRTLIEVQTLRLLAIIYLVLILGQLLSRKGSLRKLVLGLEGLVGEKKLTISLAPALIGLLPMPGGALVSAPILNQALEGERVSPEKKTYFNFWFRHIWEYMWPLYQGLILTAAIFRVKLLSLIKVQYPFTFIAAGVGVITLFLYLPPLKSQGRDIGAGKSLRNLVSSLWEILLIVLLIMLLRLPLILALAGVIFLSLILLRENIKAKLEILKKAFQFRILAIIVAVMYFKNVVMHSSMMELTSKLVSSAGEYEKLLIFLIPFSIGFLTGVNTAFAGIAFPLFIPVVGAGAPDLHKIALLYASGFAGVLLSPFHLCLALSAEYYRARLIKVYPYLLPPVAAVLAAAFLLL